MIIRSPRILKQSAKEALSAASFDPRKLALLHTGAAAAFSALLTLLNFVLSQQINNAVGLSGLGLRAVLSTAQSVLSIAAFAVIPFWEFGFTAAGLRLARKEPAVPTTLLEGFRRWGGVLRLTLLRFALYMAIMLLCLQISAVIYTVTPFSAPVMDAVLSVMESGGVPDDALLQSLMPAMLPLYGILAVALCLLLIPVHYRLRMAEFFLLDMEKPAALPALLSSWKYMRRNRLKLLHLDLSFWWYYGAMLLSSVIGYGDVLLTSLGITLPVSADAAFFLFYFLHILCQLAIAWLAGSQVSTTYAAAYGTLLCEETPMAESSLPEQL